jgi:hypothetical protein
MSSTLKLDLRSSKKPIGRVFFAELKKCIKPSQSFFL